MESESYKADKNNDSSILKKYTAKVLHRVEIIYKNDESTTYLISVVNEALPIQNLEDMKNEHLYKLDPIKGAMNKLSASLYLAAELYSKEFPKELNSILRFKNVDCAQVVSAKNIEKVLQALQRRTIIHTTLKRLSN